MPNFNKVVELSPYLRSGKMGTIEPTVQLLHPQVGEDGVSEKIASEAAEWAKDVKPEKGKTFLLVLALGASEFYGPNRNGDGFKESELKKTYKTFESDAHLFRGHVNKDPAKAIGHVVKSFYNDKMHRVELIVCLHDDKAPDVAKKVRNQANVAVSMGCRIKFDTCSICGNEAANRSQYCKHAKYKMNEILPDGRVVYVDNPNPKFFDISIVWRPADRTGYMLKKVARLGADASYDSLGESSAELGEKVSALTVLAAELQKAADMDKRVSGVAADTRNISDDDSAEAKLNKKWLEQYAHKVVDGYKKVSQVDLRGLAKHDMPSVLASLASSGIFLTTPEFLDLAFIRLTGKAAPDGMAEKLVGAQGAILRYLAEHPETAAEVLGTGIVPTPGETAPDPAIIEKMSGYLPSRSLSREWMLKRAYDFTDARTGRSWSAPEKEIARAERFQTGADSVSLVGATALGLLTYKALVATLGAHSALGKVLSVGAGALVGGKTYSGLKGRSTRAGNRSLPNNTLVVETTRQAPSASHPSHVARAHEETQHQEGGAGSWVLPTVLLADRMLSGMSGKVASANFSGLSHLGSLNLEELSHTIGSVLTK